MKKLTVLKKNKHLVTLYFDKEKKNYSYRLVFRNREELLSFENSIKNKTEVINVRADMQS